ncbi:sensor histidine kinase [Massilia antarctica]|uniref:sensor histidine kinase n=1 Tax=Massilia antarctica TaxID=2765360 RepID=UPI0022700F3F|nr:sensor histidine kinase [Massilia sp. H27-R4]MCY0911247.1 triple tyrosine motif-containing protein [Massilia sp. H27-R4]
MTPHSMSSTRWRLAAIVLALAFSGAVHAQARSLDQLEHRRWVAADGGPSQVGAIAQTGDGYLWLGTNESLFRFDGFRFVRYEAPGLNTLGIVASLLAVDDELWVGLRFGGVRVIGPRGMREHRPGPNLPEGAIYSLARDRTGAIWIAADDGLARYNGTAWELVSANWHFPGKKARAVFVDGGGTVWAAIENRLLYLPKGERRFIDSGLAVDWVSQIAQAPDGAIWLTERYSGKIHRVVLLDGHLTYSSLTTGTPAIGLLFDRSGGLWLSTTGNGVQYVANPTSIGALDSRTSFTARDGLSSDFIWKMLEDGEGNLWVGSNGGLDRFRQRALMPAGFPPGSLNFALVAGNDGSLWAGPSNRPAMRLMDGAMEVLDMPAPVSCAMRDLEGTIWMGGPSGIWRSRGAHLAKFADLPPAALAESSVRAMARDAAGDLWVSFNRLGLFRLHDGVWIATPPPSLSANQRMPVTASADAKGRPWFGYRDNLLVTREGDGEKRWGQADGMDIGHVTAITHHGQRTWVGGQRGIGYIDGEHYRALRLPDNGLFANIYAIIVVPLKDGSGDDLWVHSRSGIFQLTAAELARAYADANYRIGYRSYDLMGGLANDPYQVLPLPTAVRSGDGRLWFSTSNGVAWIDPERPRPELAGPTVLIESVHVDGVRAASGAPALLSAGAQRIVIDYTALSLSAPERLNFRYRLDGYDAGWQDAGRQREAVYTGLNAGKYRFRVLAHNQDGLPSSREAVFEFSIPPALYRQPWFLLLAGALAFAALWMLYRINMRRAAERLRERIEERHSERERIARDLHDTLLQGVHGLILRFQAIVYTIPAGSPARRSLEEALDRADEVLIEGRDRVRDLRTGAVDLSELHDALAALGAELEQKGGTRFALTVRGAPAPLRPLVRDEVYQVGHEAVVNAFRHARALHVKVDIEYGARQFQMTVGDDGLGIAPAYLTPMGRADHWGLRGMHERVGRIGALLAIHSDPARGSEVRLSIKAQLAYRRAPRRLFAWLRKKTTKGESNES